ncbi:hypothetical protein M5689_012737 [Euphorbia peplus]|nr:hypothetical protein M5689_012737 [Euphorbia peplus]
MHHDWDNFPKEKKVRRVPNHSQNSQARSPLSRRKRGQSYSPRPNTNNESQDKKVDAHEWMLGQHKATRLRDAENKKEGGHKEWIRERPKQTSSGGSAHIRRRHCQD